MALDHDGLFTIIGKYIKAINLWDGYIAAMTTQKNEIRDAYEAEDLHDVYATVPALIASAQNSLSQAIFSMIGDIGNLLLDRDYVIEQLGLSSFSVADVLDALHKYMVDNSETIDTSQVSISGSDADFAEDYYLAGAGPGTYAAPVLMCCRYLDGVSSPGNGISSSIRYSGLESQLARSTTVYAEVTDATEGQERAKIYSSGPDTGGYQIQDEEPGPGPTVVNPEVGNFVPANYDFTSFTGNAPNNWTVSGTVTTDYVDFSGTGVGPLQIKTAAVTAHQQVTGLVHNKLYFAAAMTQFIGAGTETGTSKIRFRTGAGVTLGTQRSFSYDLGVDALGTGIVWTAFVFPETVDLDDIYVEVEHDAESAGTASLKVYKVIVAEGFYYNGLGWLWWPSMPTFNSSDLIAVGDRISFAVSNNNNGVIGTFFRKAFGVQLPSTDSPTIADTLAT